MVEPTAASALSRRRTAVGWPAALDSSACSVSHLLHLLHLLQNRATIAIVSHCYALSGVKPGWRAASAMAPAVFFRMNDSQQMETSSLLKPKRSPLVTLAIQLFLSIRRRISSGSSIGQFGGIIFLFSFFYCFR